MSIEHVFFSKTTLSNVILHLQLGGGIQCHQHATISAPVLEADTPGAAVWGARGTNREVHSHFQICDDALKRPCPADHLPQDSNCSQLFRFRRDEMKEGNEECKCKCNRSGLEEGMRFFLKTCKHNTKPAATLGNDRLQFHCWAGEKFEKMQESKPLCRESKCDHAALDRQLDLILHRFRESCNDKFPPGKERFLAVGPARAADITVPWTRNKGMHFGHDAQLNKGSKTGSVLESELTLVCENGAALWRSPQGTGNPLSLVPVPGIQMPLSSIQLGMSTVRNSCSTKATQATPQLGVRGLEVQTDQQATPDALAVCFTPPMVPPPSWHFTHQLKPLTLRQQK